MVRLTEGHIYVESIKGKGERIVPGANEVMACVGTRKRCECAGNGCEKCSGSGYTKWQSISGTEYMTSYQGSMFGKAFHDYSKARMHALKNNEPLIGVSYDDRMQPWVNGLEKFITENTIQPISIEESYVHSLFNYAGTWDIYGNIKFSKERIFSLCVLDWKTSATYIPTWEYIISAYAELIKDRYNEKRKIRKISVIIVPNNYKIKEYKSPGAFNKFISILNTYKNFNS